MALNDSKIRRQFGKAVKQFNLIADGDRVLIALSGGKDSLLLTELLARQSKIFKPRFTIEAVHVRMQNVDYETDTTALEAFCRHLGVTLHVLSTAFDEPHSATVRSKPACFLCSWARRKAIFRLAQELHCNKIALGHHMDDLLHTALMNLCHEGRFGTMPAVLHLRKMPLTLIRPLCMVSEADIMVHAEAAGYPRQVRHCPHEHTSKREEARRLLLHMEQDNKEVRQSMWHALLREGKLTEQPAENDTAEM